jgi:GTPase
MTPIIAIVGRPNVGKSALFNRIVGRRIAIVHDEPGVTRDRITAEAERHGRQFTLVDTGGIGLLRGEKSDDVLTRAAFDQVQIAIESADIIFLVVNVQEGIVPLDREVAQRLRDAGKTVFVIANKVDNAAADSGVDEFAELGFERVFPVSAIHGRGLDALMNAAIALFPPIASTPETAALPSEEEATEEKDSPPPPALTTQPLKLAIVGRPNVGKSSIINALTNSDRVIVSPIPGTTRDSVDVPFTVETEGRRENYLLIDTAGLRKQRRVDDSIEFFSVKRAEESINRCDIVVLVLDAEFGITEQDKKICGKIVEAQRACIVVVNKWDLVKPELEKAAREKVVSKTPAKPKRYHGKKGDESQSTLADFAAWVQDNLFFLDYAPVIFTSAKSGLHLDRLLEAVRYVADQLKQKIPTAILNRTLHDAIERRQPVSSAGHRLKFFYATQVRQAPPTFLLFINRKDLFSDRYRKYLADQLRAAFGYEGCPIILVPKPRPQDIEPIRKRHVKRDSTRKVGRK